MRGRHLCPVGAEPWTDAVTILPWAVTCVQAHVCACSGGVGAQGLAGAFGGSAGDARLSQEPPACVLKEQCQAGQA